MTAILAILLGVCTLSAAWAAAPAGGDEGVTFALRAPDAGAVFLAGDFNGWNASDLAMSKGDDGVWTATVKLDPGSYEYKFVVDGNWREDPDNPEKKSDPFGGSNSLVTVAADGSVAVGAATVSPAPAAATGGGEAVADAKLGRPRAVEGGVLFTYLDPNAGGVFLAGSLNDWNATADPLALGEGGLWSIVKPLPAGKHEYKFVVDGAWFADPENPDTQADPYGGANSLVTIDDSGKLVAAAAAAEDPDRFRSNTSLNARVNMNGRYLTRFETARGLYGDPRYRMQRPDQAVDLNFDTQVSDVAHTMFRMRMDSGQNIIQNNIAAFLDEAYLEIKPGPFTLKAFWNQEMFTGEDPMRLGGDLDLPGTIGPDHLGAGKGGTGFLFEAQPLGFDFRGYFSNHYNHDYYNDPDLYDNTGEDRIGVRLSRRFGRFEIGLPAYVERSLVSHDFSSLLGTLPTGIPALDEHLTELNDPSTEYTVEDHRYHTGLDLRVRVLDDLVLAGQGIFVDQFQGLIWGNKSGLGENAGAINVPIHERESVRFRVQADWKPRESMKLMAQHTWNHMWGGEPNNSWLAWDFLDEGSANNRVYFTTGDALPEADSQTSELEFDWNTDSRDLKIWVWRTGTAYDYAPVGGVNPDPDSSDSVLDAEYWYLSACFGGGKPSSDVGRAELEFGCRLDESDLGRSADDYYEMIFRYDLDLTHRIGFISDLRYVNFPRGPRGDGSFLSSENQFFAPFVGFRYNPIRTMELVLAYGVDPVDFMIDYEGRQIGRWLYRQQYLFDNPDAGLQDAESFLADARVITLRAQVRF